MSGENTDPHPRVEPGIGRSLERTRKSRGLSLWQVEQETRIRSRYLHDLERENFDVLPAVYVLGSLKTYADFLGLDGAALSRQLKASLVEPAETGDPDQPAALGDARDEENEYEAAPVPAVGFDQLFLGMGVILVSILAVMTIVAAVAQGDESPISQINQPSTPEAPSEIALAGNVREDGANEVGDGSPANDETREAQPEDEAPKGNEESKKDEDQKEDAGSSQSASLFGDAEFVPMSPSSSSTAGASASVSPASATAEPDEARAPSAPEYTPPASTAPASAGASQRPPENAPSAASPAPAPAGGGGSPQAGGGGGGETAPAGGEAEEGDIGTHSASPKREAD